MKTKNVSAPFKTLLRFVEFGSGKKVVLASDNGVRHFMKQDVFAKIIRNEVMDVFCVDDSSQGLWWRGDFVTERRGTSILTRPAAEP